MCDNLKNSNISATLLSWYDENARDLPWRISPAKRKSGVVPDPYRVWMSEIMLQQTTVATVKDYFIRFTERWPTVVDLANEADDAVLAEWAGLGYYARARNLLKCAREVRDRLNGRFPDTYDELIALPGIGPYTAAAVSSIAFDRPETIVDGNVERVISRMFRIKEPLPSSKPIISDFASKLTPQKRAGDYAQAIMDLGATVCTPKSPSCLICPWQDPCMARSKGDALTYPVKLPKKKKPTRLGHAFVSKTVLGELVLEKRPENGLLGGMLGWPGSEWSEKPDFKPPFENTWNGAGRIKHTFTHFHLELQVHVAEQEALAIEDYVLKDAATFDPKSLPTVMRKVFDLAQRHMEDSTVA